MKKKSWLDGVIGWDETGSVIDTYWIGDPAIDAEKSDQARYFENMEAEALVVHPGQDPVTLRITLPNATQVMEVRSQLEISHEAAAATIFSICVRFPDDDNPANRPHLIAGSFRLPPAFMMALVRNRDIGGASMVNVIGSWIIGKSILAEQEKKASSSESTQSISEKQASTPAETAPKTESGSRDARIVAKRRKRRRG